MTLFNELLGDYWRMWGMAYENFAPIRDADLTLKNETDKSKRYNHYVVSTNENELKITQDLPGVDPANVKIFIKNDRQSLIEVLGTSETGTNFKSTYTIHHKDYDITLTTSEFKFGQLIITVPRQKQVNNAKEIKIKY